MLVRHGIAGLVYDKRGSGHSGGDVETATYEDLAVDALAAVRYLEGRPEIDRDLIGLKGGSEGGWVVPIVAAAREKTAFIVLVSATAETPAEQVRHEVGELVGRAGYPVEVASRAANLYGRLSQFERTGEGHEDLDSALRLASRESWFEAARYLPGILPAYEDVKKLSWFPAWRQKMDFPARDYLQRVKCPVLLLLGGRDPKIDSTRATKSIREALLAGGNVDFTVRVFPDAGHGLVEWFLPGHLPPPRFPDGYPEVMPQWILAAIVDDY
jgi:pimeloyl-ACP methyl ester carboxylesterase